MLPLSPKADLQHSRNRKLDYVYNCGRQLLTLGMIHQYFRDSVREGNGNRVFSMLENIPSTF